ncbi:hypothetical protein Aperf_G00000067305 [Anoplocephala perfoliata]
MSNYALIPISIYFLGHLGTAELAAGGLAISVFHVAGTSLCAGLLTASDTLFAQTYGGTNKLRLGVQVQKSIHVELWHDWNIWFRLAIPGMLMTGLEWWIGESGSILAGLRGENTLAVQTILNNFESLTFSIFPTGFSFATSLRIGRFLGANNSEIPRSTSLVGLITITILAALNSVILISVRFFVPRLFSNDPIILEWAADGFLAIACYTFVNAIVGVGTGVIRGVGMQKQGAIVCALCMYLVGGPLGLVLLLITDLRAQGFWYGLSAGMAGEAIIIVILILRINWVKMCEKAEKRTRIKFIKKTANPEEMGNETDVDVEEGNVSESSNSF